MSLAPYIEESKSGFGADLKDKFVCLTEKLVHYDDTVSFCVNDEYANLN